MTFLQRQKKKASIAPPASRDNRVNEKNFCNTLQKKISNLLKSLAVKFFDDRCPIFAAALSFSSMLSIVPFLAIVFAILKSMDLHTSLTPVILSNVAAGSQEIVSRILHYIHNTRVASVGVIGTVALLLTVMATLDTVEEAFNKICNLDREKAYHHKLRDYMVVIFGIPLLIALSASITTSLQHQDVIRWFLRLPGFGRLVLMLFRLTPYISIWIALVCLFKFIPNTRINIRNALIGGMLSGTILQMAQWLHIHFQFGVSRYNAVYGTLALLPVFMIWIYISWVIVLAGMEIVWYLQKNCDSTTPLKEAQHKEQ
ncbi:MAG: YihY/virulence factor BrkB family protein [Desulfuromonadaceae bacterium]|nr:YihY/virulence factor BrkB family protein [Desulfuromonadaceae bacterium]